MIKQASLQTKFSSITERISYSLVIAFSEKNHIDNEKVSIMTQEKFYDLMKQILLTMHKDPALLNIPIECPDDPFKAGECLNQFPERTKRFKSIYEGIASFYGFMYTAGLNGQVTTDSLVVDCNAVKPKAKPIYLEYMKLFGFGIEKSKTQIVFSYPEDHNILDAWKLLAEVSDKFGKMAPWGDGRALFNFAACIYDGNYMYWLDKSNDLLGLEPGFLRSVFGDYESRGYTLSISGDLSKNDFSMGCSSKKDVSGASFGFRSREQAMYGYSPLNFIGLKAILEQFDSLTEDMKQLLVDTCKPCNGCLFCTKGKKSKIHTQKVCYHGQERNLCPNYPNMCWHNPDITAGSVSAVKSFNDLQEDNGKDWHK